MLAPSCLSSHSLCMSISLTAVITVFVIKKVVPVSVPWASFSLLGRDPASSLGKTGSSPDAGTGRQKDSSVGLDSHQTKLHSLEDLQCTSDTADRGARLSHKHNNADSFSVWDNFRPDAHLIHRSST